MEKSADRIGISAVGEIVCTLGEGPVYDPLSQTLYWFDIVGRRLVEMLWPDGTPVVHELPEMASALAVVDGQRQLLVTETGLWLRDRKTGTLAMLMPLEANDPTTRSNDARVHPCGAFWIGTMGKKAETGAGAIYWFLRGELRRIYDRISIPNSICFAADGRAAYFTDTATGLLMRVECDPLTGLPAGEPKVFVDLNGQTGGLDGSVIDAEGILWNARWGGAALDAYAPDGRRIRTVTMPVSRVSCPAFVGPNCDRIAVTSAREGMSEEELRASPQAGMTFLVDLPVNGRFEPFVRL